MLRRAPVLVLASLWLIANWGCGPEPDLSALKLVPQISGYYDDGVVQDGPDIGQNRILPAVTFQIKNDGKIPSRVCGHYGRLLARRQRQANTTRS